ncbi:MAG TPA: lysine 2,3-aminomutase, partial [Nitrospina sp.]|nr:lysine 2,3-aminomutase [Nitrospina sp.]
KVRLLPNTVIEHNEKEVIIKNYEGKVFRYPQPVRKSATKKVPVTEEPVSTENVCQMPA